MESLKSSFTVLSAMITPAILISACGSLVLSTSNRLGRVVDRVRALSESFEKLSNELATKNNESLDKQNLFYEQLNTLTKRASLLQHTLTFLYLAISIFVTTSVFIGVASLWFESNGFVSILLGLIGTVFLLCAALLLILEAQIAVSSTYKEMDFLRAELDKQCRKNL